MISVDIIIQTLSIYTALALAFFSNTVEILNFSFQNKFITIYEFHCFNGFFYLHDNPPPPLYKLYQFKV